MAVLRRECLPADVSSSAHLSHYNAETASSGTDAWAGRYSSDSAGSVGSRGSSRVSLSSFTSWFAEAGHGTRAGEHAGDSRASWASTISEEERDLADFRCEMLQEKEEEAKLQWRSNQRFRFSCIGSNFQPKDLDLQALAQQRYGAQTNFHKISISGQVELIRDGLATRNWTMSPNSDYMKCWDGIAVLCLLFTAIVTPFEIAFLEGSDFLTLTTRIVGVLFAKDMLLQFVLQSKKQTKKGMVWRRNWQDTSKAYLKTWFLVDLVAIMPYDVILSQDHVSHKFKLTRLLRLLRLTKLLQVLRATRIVQRVQNRVSLRFMTIYLIQFQVLITLSCHWMACAWGFVGNFEESRLLCKTDLPSGDVRHTSFPWREYFFKDASTLDLYNPEAWAGESWFVRFASDYAASKPIDPCSPLTCYVVSIYWAIQTMTSIGYGDVLPYTVSEYVICTVGMMMSSLVWAYIISQACAAMMKKDPVKGGFEKRMDAFNGMCEDVEIPAHLRYAGREYIREQCYHERFSRNLESRKSCGGDLRSRIADVMSAHYFDSIWIFEKISYECKADLASKFQPAFYGKHEIVEQFGKLCIVDRGAVGRSGRVLVPWGGWGEDMILRNGMLHRRKLCTALIYTELVTLCREDTSSVLLNHPNDLLWFRRFALSIALLRTAMIYRRELALNERRAPFKWIHTLMGQAYDIAQKDQRCLKRQVSPSNNSVVSRISRTSMSSLNSIVSMKTESLPQYSTRTSVEMPPLATKSATLMEKLQSMGERLEQLQEKLKMEREQDHVGKRNFPCSL